MHKILVEAAAERDLRRLPQPEFKRIVPEIAALAQTPRPPDCRKLQGNRSDWRIRVGDYRVLYEIDDRRKLVRVLRVRHRREVYR